MPVFKVRVERLVQEFAIVEMEAETAEDAVLAAIEDPNLKFSGDVEACPPYAYGVEDQDGHDYTLADAKARGRDVGQTALGKGLETLTKGMISAALEAKAIETPFVPAKPRRPHL
ncbi:MAG: hypothetical protein Q8R64_13895 [Sulfurimicrobium sp.]|nr:hypothetical protein [Sulfurimicrobium sp.]